MKIVDKKALNTLIKLIQHDAQLYDGCSSCFIDKSEQDELIRCMKQHMILPEEYCFEIWDLIESHSNKVLSKTEMSHVNYLYKECNNFLVEEARRLSEEQDQ